LNYQLRNLEPEVYKELSLYTYKLSTNGKLSFTHQSGMHDDLVDSIMLANKSRNEIRTNAMYISPAQRAVKVGFGVA
jgi:hypothetical protein